MRAHDAGLRPQKKKRKRKKKHRGSRATQRGLGRHGSIENWEMVRVVGHLEWDKTVSRANSGDRGRFPLIRKIVKVYLQ